MAQMTWRASEELLERVRKQAVQQGKSLNEWVTAVLDAVSNPDTAGSERAQIRERLAVGGLLQAQSSEPEASRPSRRQFEAARAAAGHGTPLSDLVAKGRG